MGALSFGRMLWAACESHHLKVIIIGAGAVGAAAGRFLASAGHHVTLLEQFTPDHDRGSSFGASRIIRRVYTDPYYTALMGAAYPLWEELERQANEALMLRTGGLFFAHVASPELAAAADALRANDVPFDALDAPQAGRRFPELRLRPGEAALWQADSGLLRASACVRASLRLATAQGAQLRSNSPVLSFDTHPHAVSVRLAGGETLAADRLIVTAGPWTGALLQSRLPLPLVVTRQTYCHFLPAADPTAFTIGRFPVWIDLDAGFYGFPAHADAPGVKVAWHHQGATVDPDAVDRTVHAEDRQPLIAYCAQRLPGLSPQAALEKACLYTNTPDEDFIVGQVPGEPRITLIGGLSGHGFKFTVLLGRIAALMATDQPVPYPLRRFAIGRFPAAGAR